ncbi:ATP-binding protein [Paenibacillus silagei]|uniref:Kinase n=1 Tax=Paenibacillus silagei TaxID=1670801 RepID=A0ABS4NLZ7_9BACL|nr:ATP-binding protein [Paenibacillus silagei]MBP2111091.1 putative kinase [Paenibacillus silagei]
MKRLVILTVGKTHSGKTTFGRELERRLPESAVIDRDDVAEFINSQYESLLPKQGANTLKDALTRTLVDYAVHESEKHIIMCNNNSNREGRLRMLDWFHQKGLLSVLVYFNLPDELLYSRIASSERSTAILRKSKSFDVVLTRQIADLQKGQAEPPTERESEYLFVINDSDEVPGTIQKIVQIAGGKSI